MKEPSCFVTEIDVALASKFKEDLLAQGFELTCPKYTIFQAKKQGISCTLYESGKLTVQGKGKHEFIAFYLEPEILGKLTYSYPDADVKKTAHIGVDEAGKGDFFGPLCIAAVYADEKEISHLVKHGVRDSKRINDANILKLAKIIKESCLYSLVQIYPAKYNELYEKFRNLNNLLAWGHATSIEELIKKTSCREVIIDKFAGEHVVQSALKRKNIEVDLIQRHRGEEDTVVAAASILARAAFVQGIEKLSDQYQIILPKGASSIVIDAGRRFVAKHGRDTLNHVAKMHFKTASEILQC